VTPCSFMSRSTDRPNGSGLNLRRLAIDSLVPTAATPTRRPRTCLGYAQGWSFASPILHFPPRVIFLEASLGVIKPGHRPLSTVLRTANAARVRDGYISESTRGHARALPAHR
jgi:hypothetical protein